MKNVIRKIARIPSTERAIASITKALDELEAVVAFENESVTALQEQIDTLSTEQDAAKARAGRADKIAKRFAKLVA